MGMEGTAPLMGPISPFCAWSQLSRSAPSKALKRQRLTSIKSNTLNSSAVIQRCRWPLREKEEEQVHLQAANKQEALKTRITRRKKKAKLLDLPTTFTVLQESSLLQQKQTIRVLARLWCTEHFYTKLQNKENFVAVEMSRQEHWQNLLNQSVNV